MISAIKSFFKNAFNFHGRATRSEYWYVMLASFIIGFIIGILMVIESAITEREPILTGILESIVMLAIFIPSISLQFRRYHDAGKSGWWILINCALSFCCGVGGLISFIFSLLPSDNDNQWGPNPHNLCNPNFTTPPMNNENPYQQSYNDTYNN